MKQSQAILDIGTSKVVCMVGSSGENEQFEVQGVGVAEHEGIKKGRISDPMSLRIAIRTACDGAGDEFKRRLRSLYVGVPGSFLNVMCRKGELNFQKSKPLGENDIDRLIESSLSSEPMPQNAHHIHGVVVNYKVDGAKSDIVPIGQQASMLSGIVSHVYMEEEYERIVGGILEELNLEVARYINTTYATGLMLIPERRREQDCIILDVGAFETCLCLIRNEAPIFQKTLFVGGAHFATDLAICLDITGNLSEDIKRRHVFGLDYTGRRDAYKLDDGRIEDYDYETIQEIIEARATELSAMVLAALQDAPVDISPEIPVYLTGGGLAMMRGSREFLQARLNLPVYADLPRMPRLNTANYVSAYGLLSYACASLEYDGGAWKDSKLLQAFLNFFTK